MKCLRFGFRLDITNKTNHKRLVFRANQRKKYWHGEAVTFKKAPFFLFFVSGCGCAAKPLVSAENEVFKFCFSARSSGFDPPHIFGFQAKFKLKSSGFSS